MRPPSGEILQNEYRLRVSQVIDYIHQNYGEDLNLNKLAQMAHMSKYHFHRVFKSVAGEPVGDFIRRRRVQESLRKLILEPHKSITEVALDSGFSSSQNFAKMFKAYHGIPPSQLRQEYNWRAWCEKMKVLKGKRIDEIRSLDEYTYNRYCKVDQLPIGEILDATVVPQAHVIEMPELPIAYIRSVGASQEKIALNFQRLLEWAWPRGLLLEGVMILSVMESNPKITPPKRRLHDACITVAASLKADNMVSVRTLRAGTYAVHRCEIEPGNFQNQKAWLNLIFNWLIPSAYQLDNRPFFQSHLNDPKTHPFGKAELDLYLPIKPLYE